MIFFFKVLQFFVIHESAKDRNLRAFFSRVQNALSCNIFNQIIWLKILQDNSINSINSIVTGWDAYSYLPKIDLFLWTAFFPMGFESSLETLNVIFLNVCTKRIFLTDYEEVPVSTGIRDNRQALLINSYPAIYSWVQNINQCNKRVDRLPIVTIGG